MVFAGCAFEDGDDGEDHHGLRHYQYRSRQVDLIKEDGAQSGADGGKVEGQDGLGVAEAAFLDSVREMLSVADEGAFALADSQERYTDKIIKRNRHDDQGHEDCKCSDAVLLLIVCGSQRQDGDEVPDDERAAVAHEDAGGRKVEDEKPEQASDEDQPEGADKDLPGQSGGGEQDRGTDDCDTGTEAVHVVEEIEYVDNKHNPEDRKCGRNESVLYEELQPYIGEDRNGYCDSELQYQFDKWSEAFFVVPESYNMQDQSCGEDNHEVDGSCEKTFYVDIYRLVKERQMSRGYQESRGQDTSAEDKCNRPEDGDSAAEWNE